MHIDVFSVPTELWRASRVDWERFVPLSYFVEFQIMKEIGGFLVQTGCPYSMIAPQEHPEVRILQRVFGFLDFCSSGPENFAPGLLSAWSVEWTVEPQALVLAPK